VPLVAMFPAELEYTRGCRTSETFEEAFSVGRMADDVTGPFEGTPFASSLALLRAMISSRNLASSSLNTSLRISWISALKSLSLSNMSSIKYFNCESDPDDPLLVLPILLLCASSSTSGARVRFKYA
jgi:hypothetical protein